MLLLLLLSARVLCLAIRRENTMYPPRRQRVGWWPVPHNRHIPYTLRDTLYYSCMTAVCSNDAVAFTKMAVDGEKLWAGAGLVAGANASALGPPLTNDTYHQCRGTQ